MSTVMLQLCCAFRHEAGLVDHCMHCGQASQSGSGAIMLRGVGALPCWSRESKFDYLQPCFPAVQNTHAFLQPRAFPGCALVLLSLLALGACSTAQVLAENAASPADLSAVHSVDLATLQKLTSFPSCVTSCAIGALPHLWLSILWDLFCRGPTYSQIGCCNFSA